MSYALSLSISTIIVEIDDLTELKEKFRLPSNSNLQPSMRC